MRPDAPLIIEENRLLAPAIAGEPIELIGIVREPKEDVVVLIVVGQKLGEKQVKVVRNAPVCRHQVVAIHADSHVSGGWERSFPSEPRTANRDTARRTGKSRWPDGAPCRARSTM